MPIMPTPGRLVWYFGGHENPGEQVPEGVPLAATVAFVHPNGLINLQVIDKNGIAQSRLNVQLAQDDEVLNGAHAEWPAHALALIRELKTEFDNPPPLEGGTLGVRPIVLPKAKKV